MARHGAAPRVRGKHVVGRRTHPAPRQGVRPAARAAEPLLGAGDHPEAHRVIVPMFIALRDWVTLTPPSTCLRAVGRGGRGDLVSTSVARGEGESNGANYNVLQSLAGLRRGGEGGAARGFDTDGGARRREAARGAREAENGAARRGRVFEMRRTHSDAGFSAELRAALPLV